MAITAAKLSVLLLYRRIFRRSPFLRAVYAVGGLCLLWLLALMVVTLVQCHPIQYGWDKQVGGACVDQTITYYIFTISNMVLDVIISFMPSWMIWRLHSPLRNRILLLLVISSGLMSVSAPTARTSLTDRSVIFASIGRVRTVPNIATDDASGEPTGFQSADASIEPC